MTFYALIHAHDGQEWVQEHDSLEEALSFREHNGGRLHRRGAIPNRPGLWWIDVDEELA